MYSYIRLLVVGINAARDASSARSDKSPHSQAATGPPLLREGSAAPLDCKVHVGLSGRGTVVHSVDLLAYPTYRRWTAGELAKSSLVNGLEDRLRDVIKWIKGGSRVKATWR